LSLDAGLFVTSITATPRRPAASSVAAASRVSTT
jgi:hypothetical protein